MNYTHSVLRRRRPAPRSAPPAKRRTYSAETRAKLRAAKLGLRGAASNAWKGGRVKRGSGYVAIWVGTDHPMSDAQGYVKEHRLEMAAALGRPLTREEVVHHVNEVKDDNRLENLMLFPNQAAHVQHHANLGG